MRIAAFGFRSLPSTNGSAGADKFVEELLPRLVKRGHEVIAYNRNYKNASVSIVNYKGVKIKSFSTVGKAGFDTLWHSCRCTVDIIKNNTADIVHIQNGGNSIWALPLRLFRKKVFISQDGVDWKRDKWPWYAKIYLRLSAFISSTIPNTIIFDNIYSKALFENKFRKKFKFIPFGSEVPNVKDDFSILDKFDLLKGDYYLFVGRFIPDKGLHYLIPAFKSAYTNKKLILIGGSPNPSKYEKEILQMADSNVLFPGFLYGDDVIRLMKYCYCYIQPSDVEGLSPVILTVMGLEVPLIVSNIPENEYAVNDTALKFIKSDVDSLRNTINYANDNPLLLKDLAKKAKKRANSEFNWDKVTEDHLTIFSE